MWNSAGIDSRIWEQAKLDNPNPDKLVPVPMVGFAEIHSRLKRNEQEAELHQLAQDVSNLVDQIVHRLHYVKNSFSDLTSLH